MFGSAAAPYGGVHKDTCLILATVLVAAAAYALTMRSLITLPTPDRWAEHIQRWGIAQF